MTQESTEKNSRRNPRIEFKVAVNTGPKSRLQQFYSKNISKGGIFLEVLGQAPDVGDNLDLTFDIPGIQKGFEVTAQVIYIKPFETIDEESGESIGKTGVGLKFINLNSEDERIITEFISGKNVRVTE